MPRRSKKYWIKGIKRKMSDLGEKPQAEKKVSVWFIVLTVVMVLIALTAGIGFIFFDVAVQVSGESMIPTFHESGDRVILLKHGYSVDYGDIVVFHREGASIPPIKRIIAMGGDEIDIKNGVVYLNGVKLAETYLAEGTLTFSYDVTMPYTVPEDSVFLMGDNRGNSFDSRRYGAIKQSEILGKALFVYGNGRNTPL